MRKHTPRRILNPVPPWLRKRLTRTQVLDLALVHWQNLDQLAKGEGDEALLHQVAGGIYTWSRVAELLHRADSRFEPAVTEMQAQLELAKRLIDRYRATGRVIFTGTDYQDAKRGCDVMDELAKIVPHETAVAAAEWSEQRINQLASQPRRAPVIPTAPSIVEADVPY